MNTTARPSLMAALKHNVATRPTAVLVVIAALVCVVLVLMYQVWKATKAAAKSKLTGPTQSGIGMAARVYGGDAAGDAMQRPLASGFDIEDSTGGSLKGLLGSTCSAVDANAQEELDALSQIESLAHLGSM